MVRTVVTRGRPNPRHQTFSMRLRKARKASGLHAVGLTTSAGLGRGMVAFWEADQGLPRLPTLEKLAGALKVSPAWLAYGIGDESATAEIGLCEGLAARAKAAREALGLSMREVARRAELTEGAVRSTEGGRLPVLDTAEKLAKALGVNPAWLAFGIGPRELQRRGARSGSAADARVARQDGV